MNRRVDQKLHFVTLLLNSSDRSESVPNASAEIALVEGALFHLHVAYRAYLQELLSPFKLTSAVDSADQANAVLREQQSQSSDIDELVKLEHSGAWPAKLLAAFVSTARAVGSDENKSNAEIASNAGIALHDVTAQLDRDVLNSWLQQFRALVQRQRQHAVEW